jgi:hypothetical protein
MSSVEIKLKETDYRRLAEAARRRRTSIGQLIRQMSVEIDFNDRMRAEFVARRRNVGRAEFARLAAKIRRG